MQEEVKKLRKNWKARERVAQALGRVDTSGFDWIKSRNKHLCIKNSSGQRLGYIICFPSAVFRTLRSAAALPRV